MTFNLSANIMVCWQHCCLIHCLNWSILHCICKSTNICQTVRVLDFCHNIECTRTVLYIIYLEGHQNCMTGWKVTVVLLVSWCFVHSNKKDYKLWYWRYYPHTLRDLVFPVCGIFSLHLCGRLYSCFCTINAQQKLFVSALKHMLFSRNQ